MSQTMRIACPDPIGRIVMEKQTLPGTNDECQRNTGDIVSCTGVVHHALYNASKNAETIAPTICGPIALELPKPGFGADIPSAFR
jgi:hypothetical protein